MAKIAILGCGFGTALAVMLNKYGHRVILWSKYENEIEEIKSTRENKRLLPGIILDESIELSCDINCVKNVDFIIILLKL